MVYVVAACMQRLERRKRLGEVLRHAKGLRQERLFGILGVFGRKSAFGTEDCFGRKRAFGFLDAFGILSPFGICASGILMGFGTESLYGMEINRFGICASGMEFLFGMMERSQLGEPVRHEMPLRYFESLRHEELPVQLDRFGIIMPFSILMPSSIRCASGILFGTR